MNDEKKVLPKPTLYDELFPGRFLHAVDLKARDVTVTVADVALEVMPTEDGGQEVRGILSFAKTDKQFVLNKTNGQAIKAMFGVKVAEWRGKRITLYPTTTKLAGETVDCIRVRGSPDLTADIEYTQVLPRKKDRRIKLVKTGAKPAADAPPEAPQPTPAVEPPPAQS